MMMGFHSYGYEYETSIFTLGAPHEEAFTGRQTKLHQDNCVIDCKWSQTGDATKHLESEFEDDIVSFVTVVIDSRATICFTRSWE